MKATRTNIDDSLKYLSSSYHLQGFYVNTDNNGIEEVFYVQVNGAVNWLDMYQNMSHLIEIDDDVNVDNNSISESTFLKALAITSNPELITKLVK